MWTLGVVESEVIGQSLLSSLERGIGFEIDIFILDRTPQPFGKDIVHASASAIHIDLNVVGRKKSGVTG